MNEESMLKRTLILTGKLVAVFAIWVALLSVVATVAASRMIVALSGGAAEEGAIVPTDATKKDEVGRHRSANPPVNVASKPNG